MKDKLTIKQLPLFIALSAILTACSTLTPTAVESLQGNWKIQTILNKAVIKNSKTQLRFDEESKLSGSASCNNISSRYESQDSTLTISHIASTRKMCLPALMEQETQLLQALNKVKRYQLNDGQLSMYDQQGVLQIKAKRTKAKPNK